jgi:hypothetical protein
MIASIRGSFSGSNEGPPVTPSDDEDTYLQQSIEYVFKDDARFVLVFLFCLELIFSFLYLGAQSKFLSSFLL